MNSRGVEFWKMRCFVLVRSRFVQTQGFGAHCMAYLGLDVPVFFRFMIRTKPDAHEFPTGILEMEHLNPIQANDVIAQGESLAHHVDVNNWHGRCRGSLCWRFIVL